MVLIKRKRFDKLSKEEKEKTVQIQIKAPYINYSRSFTIRGYTVDEIFDRVFVLLREFDKLDEGESVAIRYFKGKR